MNSGYEFGWMDITLAIGGLLILISIAIGMGLLLYKDYNKFDNKNYYK